MDTRNESENDNRQVDGYKIPGDGNAPNTPPQPGNESFEPNPDAVKDKDSSDIPGKQFNINDKAYFDSSQKDYVKTVSAMHHADEDFTFNPDEGEEQSLNNKYKE